MEASGFQHAEINPEGDSREIWFLGAGRGHPSLQPSHGEFPYKFFGQHYDRPEDLGVVVQLGNHYLRRTDRSLEGARPERIKQRVKKQFAGHRGRCP